MAIKSSSYLSPLHLNLSVLNRYPISPLSVPDVTWTSTYFDLCSASIQKHVDDGTTFITLSRCCLSLLYTVHFSILCRYRPLLLLLVHFLPIVLMDTLALACSMWRSFWQCHPGIRVIFIHRQKLYLDLQWQQVLPSLTEIHSEILGIDVLHDLLGSCTF